METSSAAVTSLVREVRGLLTSVAKATGPNGRLGCAVSVQTVDFYMIQKRYEQRIFFTPTPNQKQTFFWYNNMTC
jgi:hypothetical protein